MTQGDLPTQDERLTAVGQSPQAAVIHLEEPIYLYHQIQPHGVVLVLEEPDLTIRQVSRNAQQILGLSAEEILEANLADIFESFPIEQIKAGIQEDSFDFFNPAKVRVRVQADECVTFDGIFHRNSQGVLILELEPAIPSENIPFLSFYHLAQTSIDKLETTTFSDCCQAIVQKIRKIIEFDRVMLYRFDENNYGDVIAEDKLDELEAYLGLRYPEFDIPPFARRSLSSIWTRLIADVRAEAVDIVPAINPSLEEPIDFTHSILKSASPCHLEYLQNMGVGSSLTISLIKDRKLWGIIACHHQTPKLVPYELRKACEFLGRVVFAEISSREASEDYDYRRQLTYIQSRLIDYMSQDDHFINGLVRHDPNLLNVTSSQGAAICMGENCTLVGKTPAYEDLNKLIQWLQNNVDGDIFYTDALPQIYPEAIKYKDIASGLLAIPISKRNYVLWFRPEVNRAVHWGGNPAKVYEVSDDLGNLRLSPRRSFELWQETVRLTSLPWKQVEVDAALELRKAIVNIVLRQADELAQLAGDLERSNAELKKFAYVVSHDLQEPLNQVANYVQLLEMRYRGELDEDAREFINFAVEGVNLMQTLIDDVLAYSKVDIQGEEYQQTDVQTVLERALANLRGRIAETGAKISYEPLPTLLADSTQLMQLFQNLIGNALKFRSENPPEISIGVQRQEDVWLFAIRDNGIGIDPQFSERIFVIFQRLHTRDEYPGTGMGLAICQKIVECHRGRIWVESELGRGATFYFTIPIGGRDRDRRRGRQTQNYLIGGGQ